MALPPGKSWSAVVDTFKIPAHTFGVVPRRLETDEAGRPMGFVEAQGGIGQDMYVIRWQDSTWTLVDHLTYGTKGVQPVPSPEGTQHLIWSGLEEIQPDRRSYLVMSELTGDSLIGPDTVTTIYAGSLTYAAATSSARRWVAVGDFGDLRLLFSDSPGAWNEVLVDGRGDRGVAVAALDDTSALVAWRDQFLGPGAGILSGPSWTHIGPPPMTDLFDAAPRFRLRPSGGYWLSWATMRGFVRIASYQGGNWSPAESVFCAYIRPEAHYAQSRAEMSRDAGEYPAVSWMAVSSLTGLTSVCVCVSSDSGFGVAENLPGSEDGVSPVVTRDINQDTWVAWEAPARGLGWAHTFTRAITTAPTVAAARGKRIVSWWLSEAAPGTWWAVLRAGEGESFGEVARVRATQGLQMSWEDLNAPIGVQRYRIRRECLDKQYEWLSDESQGPVDVESGAFDRMGLVLIRLSQNPSGRVLRFELLNAKAGPLDLRVYDLRGRTRFRQSSAASGSGRDSLILDLAADVTLLTSGLYFIRVVDSSGKASSGSKIVLLE